MNNKNDNGKSINEEEKDMIAAAPMNLNNSVFNEFLKMNKEKINSIVPKNPSISLDDEWRNEDFWDKEEENNT